LAAVTVTVTPGISAWSGSRTVPWTVAPPVAAACAKERELSENESARNNVRDTKRLRKDILTPDRKTIAVRGSTGTNFKKLQVGLRESLVKQP
jgi:hypothetical protein